LHRELESRESGLRVRVGREDLEIRVGGGGRGGARELGVGWGVAQESWESRGWGVRLVFFWRSPKKN